MNNLAFEAVNIYNYEQDLPLLPPPPPHSLSTKGSLETYSLLSILSPAR